jgi:small subunit ribosomal protein S14
MAKRCMFAREAKRKKLVEKFAAIRKELKAKGDNAALQQLPRNSSPNRLHSRCGLSGRPRGYMRKFGLSRIAFRDLALDGKIPGVTKASW